MVNYVQLSLIISSCYEFVPFSERKLSLPCRVWHKNLLKGPKQHHQAWLEFSAVGGTVLVMVMGI